MIVRTKYGGRNNPFNYSYFVCDTTNDINDLPTNKETGENGLETCSIGSKAIIIENRTQYILNGNNEWKLLKDYKNQSGGGSNLEIDETLTISGYAADAKVVGDKINKINEVMDLSEYAKKEDLVGQKTAEGGEIFNDYGNNSAGLHAHAEGNNTVASGESSHAEGKQGTTASGESSHAEGSYTKASGTSSHAEGHATKAIGNCSHAEGGNGVTSAPAAYGVGSHAEGMFGNTAYGNGSHAEGYMGTNAYGEGSHAEGYYTTAGTRTKNEDETYTYSGNYSHAEGNGTKASGNYSHAEGYYTVASEYATHAEGASTTASGQNSHAEGNGTKAIGYDSHAEGTCTISSGESSHAEGYYTIAYSNFQHVQGKYNIKDTEGKYAFIIGNGTDDNNRSNMIAIDWNGLIYLNNSNTGIDLSNLSRTLSTAVSQIGDIQTALASIVEVSE